MKNVNKFGTNSIMARISWRPLSMSTKKYIYTLLWASDNCKDESKQLNARTEVS